MLQFYTSGRMAGPNRDVLIYANMIARRRKYTWSVAISLENAVDGTVKQFDCSLDCRLDCDALIVGGGINGAAIARDAAGRGLRVVLCEKDDLAGHTSSASSKLIHGGLRYLEHYEFGLVRKALIERETLLRCAPHIMRPLRFVMPHESRNGRGRGPGARPAWLIRAGLFLYDRLARREFLPGSSALDLRGHPAGAPLQPRFTRGFM